MAAAATRSARAAHVCGLGAVTGYGWGLDLLWKGLGSGESAVLPRPGWEATLGHDRAWLGLVPPGGDPADGASRFARALVAAADEAVGDARGRGWRPGPVVGVVHGTAMGDLASWRDLYLEHDGVVGRRGFLQMLDSTPPHVLMRRHGFRGPCLQVNAMCATGAAAVLTGLAWLRSGAVSDVVVVVADLPGTPEYVRHLRDLGALVADAPPFQASRPFQEGSRGFVMGEGAAALVLSSRPEAAYARVLGGAMTNDAYHVASIDPSAAQVRRAFVEALADAGVAPEDVAYLDAHGPGTAQCDAAEGALLDELLPGAEGVYSAKPLSGHCQGAAAAVELVTAVRSYDQGELRLPPAVAAAHPRLLTGVLPRRPGPTLKSSLGMGGHNAAVVLAEAEG